LINGENCNYHRACSHLTTRSYFSGCLKTARKMGLPARARLVHRRRNLFRGCVSPMMASAVPDGVRR
jgi:hypothetical protein